MKVKFEFEKFENFVERVRKRARELNEKKIIDKKISKKTGFQKKQFEKHKLKSLKLSAFISLFFIFVFILYISNIFLSVSLGVLFFIIIFVLILEIPLFRKKKFAKKIESEMPNFLTGLITELKVGRTIFEAIEKCKSNGVAGKEYVKILEMVKQGVAFQKALEEMNLEFNSLIIKRVNSNLVNIYLNGNDVFSLKKFTDELLVRQRIESKEFSGKMVVYSLVFIAVSAIVPAMFISFILIGSYFMEISFSSLQIFFIITFLFPLIDLAILFLINSKTPIFLRSV